MGSTNKIELYIDRQDDTVLRPVHTTSRTEIAMGSDTGHSGTQMDTRTRRTYAYRGTLTHGHHADAYSATRGPTPHPSHNLP